MRASEQTHVSWWLTTAGGVLVWLGVPPLVDVYGVFSVAVGVLYLVTVVIVFAALVARREVGLFLAGGFVLGCLLGAATCLLRTRVAGTAVLLPMAGFVVGAAGATLGCIGGAARREVA